MFLRLLKFTGPWSFKASLHHRTMEITGVEQPVVGPIPLHLSDKPVILPPELAGLNIPSEFSDLAIRMPPLSAALLLHTSQPSTVNAHDLIEELKLPHHLKKEALKGLRTEFNDAVMLENGILTSSECEILRTAIHEEWQEKSDTIDGGPDHQLKLSVESFKNLTSNSTLKNILELAKTFSQTLTTSDFKSMKIFIRSYTPSTRPWCPFHTDSSTLTINISLSSPENYSGGILYCLSDNSVRSITRGKGDCTIHSSRLLHGVSRLRSGRRESCVIFIGDAKVRTKLLMFGEEGMPEIEDEELCFFELLENEERWKGYMNGIKINEGMENVGKKIEKVCCMYDAPHLRPTRIKVVAESNEKAGYSLRQLVVYLNGIDDE